METIQENLFKIKKIVIETRDGGIIEVVGFLTPKYNMWEPGLLRADQYNIVSIDSPDYLSLNDLCPKFIAFKKTRIADEELKKTLNQLIIKEKERYKIACQIAKLQQKAKEIEGETRVVVKTLPRLSGLLSEDEFDKLLSELTLKAPSRFYVWKKLVNGKIASIRVGKRIILGKYLDGRDYSFIHLNCAGDLDLDEDYKKNKEYQALIKTHFKPLQTKTIEGWEIREEIDAGTEDKQELNIYHEIELIPKKELSLVKENVPKVADILNQIFKQL